MTDRIKALERLLRSRPDDPRLRFGLALEYLGEDRLDDGIRELRRYLGTANDEGNAWGRLAEALLDKGRVEEARDAYRRGIDASHRHGHPTMADEFRAALADLE